ncbi:MAG: ribokinase [Atopobiaceae bacterium]|nr:ribokinase [Atopobiaceae bacterium]
MKALVFGSANLDRTYHVSRFVAEGETVSCLGMEEACGGKGFNQAIALCRAGADTVFAGAVGKDGSPLVDCLVEDGVDTRHLLRRDMPSGHAVIQLDPEGRNCIIVCPGANDSVSESDVDDVLGSFSAGDMLVVQNEMSSTGRAIRVAHELGMIVALNPSPFDERILDWDIDCADYLFVNEVEGRLLSGMEDPETILGNLHSRLPHTFIVLTLGEQGSRCIGPDGVVRSAAAMSVDVVDTTAAGDTFTGYFLASRLRGESIDEASLLASVASGLAVTRCGAAPSIPKLEEVVVLASTYGYLNRACDGYGQPDGR